MSANTKTKHFVIPDTQVRPGVPIDHFAWIGSYIVDKRPDVIVHLGDHWDMPSLNDYESHKPKFTAARRYQRDLDAGDKALDLLDNAIAKAHAYQPRKVFTGGNHDWDRYQRLIAADPRWEGALRAPFDHAKASGWQVLPYLKPIVIDGIAYCHCFVKSSNGRVTSTKWGAPNARAQVLREMRSTTAGHKPGLDIAVVPAGARSLWGLIAGSCYQHDEDWMTPQGNRYFRGVIVKHEVRAGEYDPMIVSLKYLKRRYA